MLVKDMMTRHPILIPPATLVIEAQRIMTENNVRHLPVVGDGKRLLGLITRQRLAFKPDMLGSLNVWEITRFLSNLTVKDVMLKENEVHTIGEDRTVERAARFMTDYKIGCLPVIEDGVITGILTDIDLLHSYQEMLGLPVPGVRVTIRMPNKPGEFAKLTTLLASRKLGVMGIGTYPSRRVSGYYDAVVKIPNVSMEEIKEILRQIPDHEIVDVREAV